MAGLRVSLVQPPLAWHDPPANRAHFQTLLEPLAGRTDLVVLPETFTTGFSMKVQELGEPAAGPTTAWLTGLAARLDAAITGSLITEEGGRYYNRLLWVAPSGAPRHYDKRHLFRMGREHQHFTPGRAAWSVPWRGLRVCPLVYVANWPAARADAWRQLLRARAIENQTYVVGVNRVGEAGHGVPYAGDSAAIDFLGRPLAEAGGVPAVITVELERAPLDAYREKFPAHLDGDRFTLEL